MNSSTINVMTAKWLTILRDYEKIKAGNCTIFKTVNQLCQAHKVHRKDIRKLDRLENLTTREARL